MFKNLIALLFTSLILTSCGGGSSSDDDPIQTSEGVFLDSAVQGISYQSGTITGVTDINGTFQYVTGSPITFKIGGITLGTVLGGSVITPLSLVPNAVDENDDAVVNILRFLQTIDDDGDVTNGIEITQQMRTLIANEVINFSQTLIAFGADQNVIDLVANITGISSSGLGALIDGSVALTHFQQTLADLITPPNDSSYCSANTPTLSSSAGNIYKFQTANGECLGIIDDGALKKSIPATVGPVNISDDIVDPNSVSVSVDNNVKLTLRKSGFNFNGFDLYATLKIINSSAEAYCMGPINFTFKDTQDNEVVLPLEMSRATGSGAALFLGRQQRCFPAGFEHLFVGKVSQVSEEMYSAITSVAFNVNVFPLRDGFGPNVLAGLLDAEMSWTISSEVFNYPILTVTLTNNLSKDVRLDRHSDRMFFFDANDYAVSSSSLNIHEGLGLDEAIDLVDSDYVISANGGTMVLKDEIANNAAVTPSTSTVGRLYLDWTHEELEP